MLIAISGSQGAGKSTILDKLKELGYKSIERKSSRSVLNDWGVTLHQVNNDPDLTIKFQAEILKRKHEDDLKAYLSDELWFTERTPIDFAIYLIASLGKNNEHNEWIDAYCDRCIQMCSVYSHVFYIKAGHFDIIQDGVRAGGKHYSKMIDNSMLSYSKTTFKPNNMTVVDTSSIDSRIDIIESVIRKNNLLFSPSEIEIINLVENVLFIELYRSDLDHSFERLGADGADMADLFRVVEQEFNIGISFSEWEKITTTQQLIDYVKENHV